MENTPTVKINPIIVGAIFAQIVFLIVAFFILKNLLGPEQKVAKISIDNDSSSENLNSFPLDATKKSVIEGQLNNIVALNNLGSIAGSGATIRSGSIDSMYVKDIDVYYLSMIVDLKSLNQSYRLVYRDSETVPNQAVPSNNPAIFYCTEENFGESKCQDDYPDNIEDQIIYEMVRNKTFSNFTVGLVGDVYNGGKLSFRLNTLSDDPRVISEAEDELSEYLSSLGFSLENYEYTAGSYICCSLD